MKQPCELKRPNIIFIVINFSVSVIDRCNWLPDDMCLVFIHMSIKARTIFLYNKRLVLVHVLAYSLRYKDALLKGIRYRVRSLRDHLLEATKVEWGLSWEVTRGYERLFHVLTLILLILAFSYGIFQGSIVWTISSRNGLYTSVRFDCCVCSLSW